jgi:hypothetical protein
MKKMYFTCIAAILAFSVPAFSRDVSVKGHYRSNGTYVEPYTRTAPDSSTYNNYSTKGNTNPYTGKEGTVDPYKPKSYDQGYNYGSGNRNSNETSDSPSY